MGERYDPRFLDRSPMLAPLRTHAATLETATDWPERSTLQSLLAARGVTTAGGVPPTLVDASAESYEKQLYLRGELQVRSRNWHDLFNVLAWITYPQAKRELNRRHYLATQTEGNQRGRVRDALTVFDESGVVVVSSDSSLLTALRQFQWKPLFWERRTEVREHMRVFVFGHALMEKALAPYIGLTAHALLIEATPAGKSTDEIDMLIAERLRDPQLFLTPRMLAPLPVLGVPGWWADNAHAAFYDNTEYFRPGRRN